MCITDGSIDCIIDPISNALYNVIYPFFAWIYNTLFGVALFIYNMGMLLVSISNLLIGLLGDVFAANVYAATLFTLILSMISMVVFIRIYNLIADLNIAGFKLPTIKRNK
jgi:hypothetical protein